MNVTSSRAAGRRARLADGGAPAGRGVRLALAAVCGLLLVLLLPAGALAARTPFDGGPIVADTPTVVANDGTVYALRFSATSGGADPLAADTTYFVKVRFTPNSDGTPASTSNRGFTWNPASSAWAFWDDDWPGFPTVTTDGSGAVVQSQWLFFRFSDTTKTGDYYLIISLSVGGTGNTKNGTSFVHVVVTDPRSASGWVHAGVATGAGSGAAVRLVDHGSASAPLATQGAELNGVDDDLNGVIDDEVYGPVQAGGFRVGAPTGRALDVTLGGSTWPSAAGFTLAVPDTDIALGAADQTAPTAPSALTAAPRNVGAALSWGPAVDADGGGVSAYRVYRWVDAPVGAGYTTQPMRVATVTGATTWTDSGLTNGATYRYEVRAVDAATNVGPRSVTAGVTPDGTVPGPVTALTAAPGDGRVDLSWANPADADFAGVKVVRKAGASPSSPTDGVTVYDGAGTTCTDGGVSNGTRYYYAVWAYDAAQNLSSPATASATPNPPTTLTFSASPAAVVWGKTWSLAGELRAADGAPVPGAVVDLEQSADDGVTWAVVTALAPTAGTSTYAGEFAAPASATKYRLAFAGDATHAASWSKPVTVKPCAALGKPRAPSRVARGKKFTVSGSLTPRLSSAFVVKIQCLQKKGSKWKLRKTVRAKVTTAGSASRYSASLSLTTKGAWRLVAATAETASFGAAASAARKLTVR